MPRKRLVEGWQLEEAMRRFYALPAREQIDAYRRMREYLRERGVETRAEREIDERAGALEAIGKVARKLGLAEGEAPKSPQFNAAAPEAAPGWDTNRVRRAWGRWRFAVDAYKGGAIRQSARQVALRRRHGGVAHTREEALTALRAWLASDPLLFYSRDYEAWAREQNNTLAPDEKPYPLQRSVRRRLGLSWSDALRVARGEIEISKARRQTQRRRRDTCHGPHDLISVRTIADLAEISEPQARDLSHKRGFPAPVMTVNKGRLWLREDVETHLAGKPLPRRQREGIREQYLVAHEVATMIGLNRREALSMPGCPSPRPTVLVGNTRLWLRTEVERWVKENQELVERRKRRRVFQPTATSRRR